MNDNINNYFGIIFIVASLHRIYFKNKRLEEMKNLNLPKYFDILIIIFELSIGLLLLISNNIEFKIKLYKLLFCFIMLGTILIIFYNCDKLISTYNTLWTYEPNCLSFVYHLVYLLVIYYIILNNSKYLSTNKII